MCEFVWWTGREDLLHELVSKSILLLLGMLFVQLGPTLIPALQTIYYTPKKWTGFKKRLASYFRTDGCNMSFSHPYTYVYCVCMVSMVKLAIQRSVINDFSTARMKYTYFLWTQTHVIAQREWFASSNALVSMCVHAWAFCNSMLFQNRHIIPRAYTTNKTNTSLACQHVALFTLAVLITPIICLSPDLRKETAWAVWYANLLPFFLAQLVPSLWSWRYTAVISGKNDSDTLDLMYVYTE